MQIWWPVHFAAGVTDYPPVNKVVSGFPYDFGSMVGTFVPDYPPQDKVVNGFRYAFDTMTGTYSPTLQQPNFTAVTLPDVSDSLLEWFQPMNFIMIAKSDVAFQAIETPTTIAFRGVWQPLTGQQLYMKPEGQRAWKWFMCHATQNLALDPDDVIGCRGVSYRVMSKKDYTNYGYIEYHLVEDYLVVAP